MPPMKPAVSLLTLMPLVRTSVGIRPRTEFTRFCTSTAARSGSRDTSNVTVMVDTPALVDEDVI